MKFFTMIPITIFAILFIALTNTTAAITTTTTTTTIDMSPVAVETMILIDNNTNNTIAVTVPKSFSEVPLTFKVQLEADAKKVCATTHKCLLTMAAVLAVSLGAYISAISWLWALLGFSHPLITCAAVLSLVLYMTISKQQQEEEEEDSDDCNSERVIIDTTTTTTAEDCAQLREAQSNKNKKNGSGNNDDDCVQLRETQSSTTSNNTHDNSSDEQSLPSLATQTTIDEDDNSVEEEEQHTEYNCSYNNEPKERQELPSPYECAIKVEGRRGRTLEARVQKWGAVLADGTIIYSDPEMMYQFY